MSDLPLLNRASHQCPSYTERVMQFGEGNFLRAFVDWMLDKMNKEAGFDGGVVAVQPIDKGLINMLNDQDGLYTLYMNGIKNGEAVSEHQVVDCIQRGIDPYTDFEGLKALAVSEHLRFVISNTTEAGITYQEGNRYEDTPPASFPAKVTVLLHHRFKAFQGAADKGLIFIPCELIDRNGDNLKKIVLQYAKEWSLEPEFCAWVEANNIFCNTLVDRIVPGYPRDKIDAITKELGYKDNLVVEGEQFHLWVIEGPAEVKAEFPSEQCGLNVVFTDNMAPYRTRKVRILNGAHTTMVPVAYLYGIEYVRESVEHDVVGEWIKSAIFDEIVPTLDLPLEELNQFSSDVLDRFRNPYLKHALMSIALNSVSKFKTRVLPSLTEYIARKGALPQKLCYSLAALLCFYKGQVGDKTIALNDDQPVLDFASETWQKYDGSEGSVKSVVSAFLANASFWGEDLSARDGLVDLVSANASAILEKGVVATIGEVK